MKQHHCVTEEGEHFLLYENDEGVHICPVCGSAELAAPAYNNNGLPSFQMCSCEFEYGYDDSPLASSRAVKGGLQKNWEVWRKRVIQRSSHLPESLAKCESNLKNIGIVLAYDLIPVQKGQNT
ncbi:hypothetical protein [Pseudoalteromonas rubra]|uniref:hypothetical protein n=1 Tax=Pseudoalteromonas rubra TaxID=43658 RepID=UPI00058CE5DC|nr:hypothetical protein [Pseudoalteromonas rubra]